MVVIPGVGIGLGLDFMITSVLMLCLFGFNCRGGDNGIGGGFGSVDKWLELWCIEETD